MTDPIIVMLILAIAGAVAAIVWGDAKIRRAGQIGLVGAVVGLVWRLLGRTKTQEPPHHPHVAVPRPVETEALDHLSSKTDEDIKEIEEEIDAIMDEYEGELHRAGDAPGDVAAGSRTAERLRRLREE